MALAVELQAIGGIEVSEQRTAEQKLKSVLKEARAFVDGHSESWYYSGQELLGKLTAALGEPCPPPIAADSTVSIEVRKARQYAIDAWAKYHNG